MPESLPMKTPALTRPAMLASALCLLAAALAPAQAEEDPHAHHHHQMAMTEPSVNVTSASYRLAPVVLVKADGKRTDLVRELTDKRPVLLNFIFTTCTAICPAMTHTLAEVQRQLGSEADNIHVMSISIDPENDTPAKLRAYAQQYGAGANWDFYTGSANDSIAVQKVFAAYRGDKMNHEGLTLMRAAPGKPWVRLDGLANPNQIVTEFRKLASAH
jgi:protein SCO1/2